MHVRVPPRGRSTTMLCTLAALAGGGATATAAEGPGGAAPGPAPVARAAQCVRACPALDEAAAGSVVRVTGRNLAGARTVLFYGHRGGADNTAATPRHAGATHVDVRVPAGTRTGRVAVVSADGQVSRSTSTPLTVARPIGVRAPAPAASASTDIDAQVNQTRMFYGGRRKASLHFVLRTPNASDVRVDLVALAGGESVAHWIAYGVQPGAVETVTWNGRAGRRSAPAGRYEFRVAVGTQPATASARSSARIPVQSSSANPPPPVSATPAGRIRLVTDMFPIRGRHSFGSGGNRFGAGRSGHTHQGQDVMAACGTRLVAARGGVVKWVDFQSLAGNYLVIDQAGTRVDAAYMHLRERPLVKKGQHVYTGQTIGHVGDTGDATACHLHFELWSAPGWYSGGRPFDPLPELKEWDRTS
jgi:murein DD-endopeptidase MepM/ murein hydrolase activator NlpD